MIQQILTYSYDVLIFGSIGWMTLAFVRHLASATVKTPEQETAEMVERLMELIPAKSEWEDPIDGASGAEMDAIVTAAPDDLVEPEPQQRPQMSDRVMPFRRRQPQPQTIDWQTLTPQQLRQECQKRGIKWRNAHGKGKHLKKQEMIGALQQKAA